MKKIIRLSATLMGAFSLLTGVTACSDSDEGISKNGVECCSVSYSYYGNTYKFVICADGAYAYYTNGKITESDYDSDISDNWSYYKSIYVSYGAKCS